MNKEFLVCVCRFDTVSDLRGKDRTYENIKAAVLAAGKFSCFDVETDKDGRMFTELCRDPEIETFDIGYPWTGVRRRTQHAPDVAKAAAQKGALPTSLGSIVIANKGASCLISVLQSCSSVSLVKKSHRPKSTRGAVGEALSG